MGVKYNIAEVIEQYNCGSNSWAELKVEVYRSNDTIMIKDLDDEDVIYLHIDQAQRLKEILNEVLTDY